MSNAKKLLTSRRYFKNGLAKVSLQIFHHSLPKKSMTKIRPISLNTLANVLVSVTFIVKFGEWEHDTPYALEINSNCGI